jgi:hypothetical protein
MLHGFTRVAVLGSLASTRAGESKISLSFAVVGIIIYISYFYLLQYLKFTPWQGQNAIPKNDV